MPDPDKRVLVLLYPGCIVFEVMLALELLRPHHPVDAAYPTAGDHPVSSGLTVRPQLTYGEIDIGRYGCIIVPGGDPKAVMEDGRVDEVLRRANARTLPVAGISAGVLVLAKSGILVGKRITHSYRAPFAPEEHEDFVAPFLAGRACR